MLVVELLEHIRLELLVLAHRLEDLLALLVRGGLDQVRDLGGVKPAQPRRELQPRRRHVADERLEVRPRDELTVLAVVAAEAPRQQPPEPRPEARVDPRDAPHAVLVATSSTSRAVTSRAVATLIRLRSSTSARSSISPGRRSNWARFSFVVDVRHGVGPELLDPRRSARTSRARRFAPSGRSPAAARRRCPAGRPRPRRGRAARRRSRAVDCPPPMRHGLRRASVAARRRLAPAGGDSVRSQGSAPPAPRRCGRCRRRRRPPGRPAASARSTAARRARRRPRCGS